MIKWAVRIVALVFLIGCGVTVYLFREVGQQGSGTVEGWIGSQFSLITNSYLNPRLSFAGLDYEYPGTVRLRELRLTATDPANPEQTIDILSAGRAVVVLGEVPSVGKPIIIESITVEHPTVRAIATVPGGSEFVGFSTLLREPDPESFFKKHRVSDIFRMRLVELTDATLVYDPRLPGTVPMQLDDVTTRLVIQPTADGRYTLATRLARAPLFDLKIAGDLDLDRFHIRGLDLSLMAELAREHDRFLPPQLQQVLARHEVRGKVDLAVKGDFALNDPMAAKLSANLRLREASIGLEGLHSPIDDLTVHATMDGGRLGVPGFQLKGLAFTAPDPADPARSIVILGAESISFVLSEMRSLLGPLVFERITIDRPVVRAVSITPGSFEFAGFTQLLTMSTDATPVGPTPALSKDVAAVVGKLSDFLQMRRVEVNDATVVYDPRLPDTQPMQLDGITSRLDIEPTDGGSYQLATTLGRPPLFDVRVAGRLNLDTFDLRGLEVNANVVLSRDNDAVLPPQVQQPLKAHDVRGTMNVTVRGDVPLTDPLAGRLATEVNLRNANVAVDEFLVPIEELNVVALYADGAVEFPAVNLTALRGEMNLTARVALDDVLTTDATVHIGEMILQDTLRAGASADEPPKYSGRVNAELELEAAPVLTIAKRVIAALPPTTMPATQPATLPADGAPSDGPAAPPVTQPASPIAADDLPAYWGGGWVTVDEGRLVAATVVQRFSNAVKKLNKADMDQLNERARLDLEFGGDAVILTQIHYASNVAVARGAGTMSLARDLNLILNGGPLEKLQSLLGGFGEAFGRATDAMSGYRVTGKLEDPQVQLELGKTTVNVAARKTGNVIDQGAKATTQGIGSAGKKVGGFLNRVLKKKGE